MRSEKPRDFEKMQFKVIRSKNINIWFLTEICKEHC